MAQHARMAEPLLEPCRTKLERRLQCCSLSLYSVLTLGLVDGKQPDNKEGRATAAPELQFAKQPLQSTACAPLTLLVFGQATTLGLLTKDGTDALQRSCNTITIIDMSF